MHLQIIFMYFFIVSVSAVVEPVSPRVNVVINNTASISFTIINWNETIIAYTTQWEFKPLGTDEFSYINDTESAHLTGNVLTLILRSAQLHHRGTYRITVSNPAGSSTATIDLNVFGKLTCDSTKLPP